VSLSPESIEVGPVLPDGNRPDRPHHGSVAVWGRAVHAAVRARSGVGPIKDSGAQPALLRLLSRETRACDWTLEDDEGPHSQSRG
jgi:hypothetical protein